MAGRKERRSRWKIFLFNPKIEPMAGAEASATKEEQKKVKNELQEAWDYVSKTYFPGWNRRDKWKARRRWNLAPSGLCDRRKKLILIQSLNPGAPGMHEFNLTVALLIHEICHVGAFGHERKWQRLMMEKSRIADKNKEPKLAQYLRWEVEKYKETPAVTAQMIYSRIEDCVNYDAVGIKFGDLMKSIAREYGMTVKEFRKRYKKCLAVYRKAIEWNREEERLKKEFMGVRR